MKQYICPHCGIKHWAPLPECTDCGESNAPNDYRVEETPPPPMPPEVNYLTLTGDTGNSIDVRKMKFPLEVGQRMLSTISSCSKQAEPVQFRLLWKKDTCYLQSIDGTRNATTLNGTPVLGEAAIKQGDLITLCGRSSGKQGLTLLALYKL